ncbi:MarR family winged helix-turn-helix transcriptional regulator [Streptomyces reniochalinae]|uniref:MarR family transcriptional regulator n=1 Tax=Streptomyces reniochalinae TaxID=2250578 RepID=A0A367EE31_9ACTN|nr:MarR family transcriptional regulator [Streptomyces reniochalinae]RCG15982.1 MarR family transcriptional regulator [Streptomyces reniochalinae]
MPHKDSGRARKPAETAGTAKPAETTELAAEVAAAVGALGRHLRAASPAGELTPTQRSVLGRILRTGPTTIAALARAELVRPQSMRVTVGALEERGVLARSPHPTDGRQVVFALTPEGARTLDAVRRAKHDWLSEALATRLDSAERGTLAAAAVLLRRLVAESGPAVGDHESAEAEDPSGAEDGSGAQDSR